MGGICGRSIVAARLIGVSVSPTRWAVVQALASVPAGPLAGMGRSREADWQPSHPDACASAGSLVVGRRTNRGLDLGAWFGFTPTPLTGNPSAVVK
jgi:hypothetical protein